MRAAGDRLDMEAVVSTVERFLPEPVEGLAVRLSTDRYWLAVGIVAGARAVLAELLEDAAIGDPERLERSLRDVASMLREHVTLADVWTLIVGRDYGNAYAAARDLCGNAITAYPEFPADFRSRMATRRAVLRWRAVGVGHLHRGDAAARRDGRHSRFTVSRSPGWPRCPRGGRHSFVATKKTQPLPKRFQPYANQAATEAALRYGAQEDALQSIFGQTTADYQRQAAAQDAASRSLLGSLQSAGVDSEPRVRAMPG